MRMAWIFNVYSVICISACTELVQNQSDSGSNTSDSTASSIDANIVGTGDSSSSSSDSHTEKINADAFYTAGRKEAGVVVEPKTCIPSAEICNGFDDDCDGITDEDVTRLCGSDIGICKKGVLACNTGKWDDEATDCKGEIGPTDEICDSDEKDENCNGVANENCSCVNGETKPCGNSTPPCKQGITTCVNDVWSIECIGEIKGSEEVCDGIDNDCNGTIDDIDQEQCIGNKNKCGGIKGCVECLVNGDCDDKVAVCQSVVCDALNTCVTNDLSDGEKCKTSKENDGECRSGECIISDRDLLEYVASNDFGSIQGAKHWYYQQYNGSYSNMQNWESSYWRGSEKWVRIGDDWQHPGETYDSVRKWVAPFNGIITVTGTAKIDDVGSDGVGTEDGVTVRIKNQKGNSLWSIKVGATDTTEYSHDLSLEVAVGDSIDFVVSMNSSSSYYTVSWNPMIMYTTY